MVLKVYIGDWSNGMTGVSKTLSGSSILSSPVLQTVILIQGMAVICLPETFDMKQIDDLLIAVQGEKKV